MVDRPTEADVVEYVATFGEGISAVEVMRHFVDKGYDQRSVQRAMQRTLDKGALKLGEKLRLTAVGQLVAA
jgi:hypothetical protein